MLGILRAARVGLPENVLAAINDGLTVAAFRGDDDGPDDERGRTRSQSPWAAVTEKLNGERRAKGETPTPEGAT